MNIESDVTNKYKDFIIELSNFYGSRTVEVRVSKEVYQSFRGGLNKDPVIPTWSEARVQMSVQLLTTVPHLSKFGWDARLPEAVGLICVDQQMQNSIGSEPPVVVNLLFEVNYDDNISL